MFAGNPRYTAFVAAFADSNGMNAVEAECFLDGLLAKDALRFIRRSHDGDKFKLLSDNGWLDLTITAVSERSNA